MSIPGTTSERYHFMFCDDDPVILDTLFEKTILAFSALGIHAEGQRFSDPHILMEQQKQNIPEILLLDIDMPALNGMDIARKLLEMDESIRPLIIFVTQYDALVYQSFSCRPFGFIRKRFFEEEIEETLKRADTELTRRKAFFTFQGCGGVCRLRFDDILYFESEANYIRIHSVGESDFQRFRGTLHALEESLRGRGFLRIHKGFLVNQLHIYVVRNEEIELDNHELLSMGRVNREQIRRAILAWMR